MNQKSSQKIFKIKVILLSLAALILSVSCQKSETNDLQEAQYCLNKATASTALACTSKISSLNNTNSNKLLCAAVFISQGFGSPASFATALQQIGGTTDQSGCTGSSCSSTLSAMTALNFGIDTAAADQAISYCSKSGVVSYAQMSSIFSIGTYLKLATSVANPTNGQMEAALISLAPEVVGAIVNATFVASCSNLDSASASTKAYCAEMQVAISASGGSNAAIGACLKAKLDNPALTACP